MKIHFLWNTLKKIKKIHMDCFYYNFMVLVNVTICDLGIKEAIFFTFHDNCYSIYRPLPFEKLLI